MLEWQPIDAGGPFDTLIASWNADTPAGTWVKVELKTSRDAETWTGWYNMGIWASDTATIERHSVDEQNDTIGYVSTDTLFMRGATTYRHYQYRVTLFSINQNSPRLHLLSVMTSDSYKERGGYEIGPGGVGYGQDLAVPQRSQMIYKDGGEVWCSPTSTSMVLAYWSDRGAFPTGVSVPSVPEAAATTYDYVYGGNGNWPFNTAWAATYGLEAYVTRMSSMAQIEEWTNAGVPVIISYAFAAGELAGTPIASSAGHIMVVRGFDADGDVIVNDPAAPSDDTVRRVYDRDDLERLWLDHSGGTVYLIYPQHRTVPTSNRHGSW